MKRGDLRRLVYFLWIPLTVFAQDNETCVSCHEDESLQTVRYGIPISLYVTEEHLDGTPHEGFACIDCHTDLEGVDEFPHPSRLTLPDCGSCHQDAQAEFIDGFFQPLREKGYTSIPTCSDCHGRHRVTWKGHPQKVCGVCHQDILQEFLHSAHWVEEMEESEVTCVSCHSPHFKHEKQSFTPEAWQLHLCHPAGNATRKRSPTILRASIIGRWRMVISARPFVPIVTPSTRFFLPGTLRAWYR